MVMGFILLLLVPVAVVALIREMGGIVHLMALLLLVAGSVIRSIRDTRVGLVVVVLGQVIRVGSRLVRMARHLLTLIQTISTGITGLVGEPGVRFIVTPVDIPVRVTRVVMGTQTTRSQVLVAVVVVLVLPVNRLGTTRRHRTLHRLFHGYRSPELPRMTFGGMGVLVVMAVLALPMFTKQATRRCMPVAVVGAIRGRQRPDLPTYSIVGVWVDLVVEGTLEFMVTLLVLKPRSRLEQSRLMVLLALRSMEGKTALPIRVAVVVEPASGSTPRTT